LKCVEEIAQGALEVKGSRFISFLLPHTLYEQTLKKIKDDHPKARHIVVAGRFFNADGQLEEFFSDDREPKGSAGFPTLKVLQGNELVESAIITVRYFGGTLLGVGGLVRAYGDSANLAIKNGKIVEYKKLEDRLYRILYRDISRAEYILNKHSITIIKKEFNEDGGDFVCQGEAERLLNFERDFGES